LVYGKEAILPNKLYLPSLQLAQASRGQSSSALQQRISTLLMLDEEIEKAKVKFIALQQRISTLLMLDEEIEKAKVKFIAHQQVVKRWFDKHKAREKI
jgi:hypothetical protein